MSGHGKIQAVVIGSGAGGGAMAWKLASLGISVICLEAGPEFDPFSDYHLDRPDWERQMFPHKPDSRGRYRFGELQALETRWDGLRSWNQVNGRYNSGERRLPSGPGYHHVQGVGGSTLHFTGEAHRLHPEAMRMRSRFGVAADWPIDYRELEPWYLQAERLIGVAGPDDPEVRWRSAPYPLPPHRPGKASQLVMRATREAGFHWQPNARTALSRAYDGRPPCNYCNNCNRGCPRTDKGSVDVTFIRKAKRLPHFELRARSRVTRLIAGANGLIEAVHYVDESGREQQLQPEVVVVACGAIETPRLLLNSANRHAPSGPGNESGQVGQHLMETLFWSSNGLVPGDEPIQSFKGLPADLICWDYNAPDAIPGVIGGFRIGMGVAEANMVGPIAYATRAIPGWGAAHKQAMRQYFGQALAIDAIGESLPNPGSFVDLDPQAKDDLGQPLARIHSQLPEMELKRLQVMQAACRRILKLCGVRTLLEEYGSYDYFSATHVFGTCRMGSDPKQSVTDPWGRCHAWKNLYICDASLFPSSGGGESPSLTIEALALRNGTHIAKRLERNRI